MTPAEFKRRFLAQVLADAGLDDFPELRLELSEFLSFDRTTLESHGLRGDDVDFLVSAGLPIEAAPFLNFSAYTRKELDDLYGVHELPRTLFPLGQTGSGDMLGIELPTRQVVFLNHDDGMRRVFVNSSLPQFAEALCLYQEHFRARKPGEFLAKLASIDPDAVAEGTMWRVDAMDEE